MGLVITKLMSKVFVIPVVVSELIFDKTLLALHERSACKHFSEVELLQKMVAV